MDTRPLSRRSFVSRAGSLTAAAVFAPQALARELTGSPAALLRGGKFRDGVMSGDPTPRGVTLWTRLAGVEGTGGVRLEVARDAGFRRVVAAEQIRTGPGSGHTVKARIGRLDPNERYYYRFETKGGESPVGRFQTALPADSNQPVTIGFFSCQDYAHGYYHAMALLADDDVDFVVNLGDYIYAEDYYTPGSPDANEDGSGGTGVRRDTVGHADTLAKYRAKYRLYRSDRALRDMHARFPMVSIWDDHEVVNNWAGGAPEGGGEVPAKRRRAAMKAFVENMPFFTGPGGRYYRELAFGKTVEVIVLDERRYREDQPCDDAVAPPCAEWDQPRTFLGSDQMAFFKKRLTGSRANWKLVANEVPFVDLKVSPENYYGYDSWQGYPRERSEVTGYLQSNGVDDVVFVTGDIHTFFAADVEADDGTVVSSEFTTGSITSENLGENGAGLGFGNDADPNTPPGIIDYLKSVNPHIDSADADKHGYLRVKASRSELDVRYRRVDSIKRKQTKRLSDIRYTLPRGSKGVKGRRRN